jgi:hypothetical protein
MLLRCPACRVEINHNSNQRPDPSATFRCDVCQLNLRFNRRLGKMIIAPFQPDRLASGPDTPPPRLLPTVLKLTTTK